MRILHVIRSDAFAGVERHVALLAKAQHDAGQDVAVIGGDPVAMRAALARPAISHLPGRTLSAAVRAVGRLGAGRDVLHVHMTAAELAASMSFRARAVPVVATRHFAGQRGNGFLGGAVARIVSRRIRAQIAVSRFVAANSDGASAVVHPGVPNRPEALSTGERQKVVLVAQRLESEKHTNIALRAFASSGLAAQGWQLHVAGDGAQRPVLEELAAGLGFQQTIRFLGHRADVEALMARASIFLAPCEREGLGLSVVEAMAAGLPVVAAAGGGHLETVGLVAGGCLFAPGDAEAAGDLLGGLGRDPARRESYASALRQVQRSHFTLEAQERATDAVYRSVL